MCVRKYIWSIRSVITNCYFYFSRVAFSHDWLPTGLSKLLRISFFLINLNQFASKLIVWRSVPTHLTLRWWVGFFPLCYCDVKDKNAMKCWRSHDDANNIRTTSKTCKSFKQQLKIIWPRSDRNAQVAHNYLRPHFIWKSSDVSLLRSYTTVDCCTWGCSVVFLLNRFVRTIMFSTIDTCSTANLSKYYIFCCLYF